MRHRVWATMLESRFVHGRSSASGRVVYPDGTVYEGALHPTDSWRAGGRGSRTLPDGDLLVGRFTHTFHEDGTRTRVLPDGRVCQWWIARRQTIAGPTLLGPPPQVDSTSACGAFTP